MTSESDPELPSLVATTLADRYVIERKLGAGGMATVYLARDVKLDRQVAVKVLHPKLAAVVGADRFLAEIRITARLDHPHIVTLIDSGATDQFVYYVLPYVRGESLRDRLTRERQLSIEDAVRITTQLAGALDYAHRQGVVHRDIKPENILLHEGEAVLADFGIALAVTEAGGQRLTETGMSLGTPQYMSPEQAVGERTLDARSDVYSLGAVLYEMLAGEPPHAAPSAQAVIARRLTEPPAGLHAVRDSVPEPVERAIMKSLARVPADRFASAGAFALAVETGALRAAPARAARRTTRVALIVLGGVVATVFGTWMVATIRAPSHHAAAVLRDRVQLTSSGQIKYPALSPDGKVLAYAVRDCSHGECRFAVELQDVGGTDTRRVFDGAMAIRDIAWSPDRRHVLVSGTFGDRPGVELVSTLAGAPAFFPAVTARFFAGGDSLLFTPDAAPGSLFWLRVAGIDGVARDSIRVAGPARDTWPATPVPGSPWFVVGIGTGPFVELRAIDRQGQVRDRRKVQSLALLRTSIDAVWMQLSNDLSGEDIVRIPFDARTGRFSPTVDSLYKGDATSFDVTADGTALVLDEGVVERDLYGIDVRDALHGVFTPERRFWRGFSPVDGAISPDGSRELMWSIAANETRLTMQPFGGGSPSSQSFPGSVVELGFRDSLTLFVATMEAGRLRLALVDARTGAHRAEFTAPDSAVTDIAMLPGGGWAWIPLDGASIRVVRSGETTPRTFPKPEWYGQLSMLVAMPDGKHVAFLGWRAVSRDSLRMSVLSLDDGRATTLVTKAAADGFVQRLGDGSFVLCISMGQSMSMFRVRGEGRIEQVGVIPRPAIEAGFSMDFKRAVIVVREEVADAWMSRVVRR